MSEYKYNIFKVDQKKFNQSNVRIGVYMKSLQKYLEIIYQMDKNRLFYNEVNMYAILEKRRQELHEEVLKEYGKDREDKEFRFWLAQICKSYLSKE
jgi:hypothetical protein